MNPSTRVEGSSYRTGQERNPEPYWTPPPESVRSGATDPGIVTGSLVWYDEPVELLEQCVAGIAKVADRVVAVDGAYRRYPNAKPTSPREQAAAIRRTARQAGIECLVLAPDRLWLGQVEKRSYALAAASVGSDWIAVTDADHIIDTDREEARAALARLPREAACASVVMLTPPDPKRPLEKTSATGWHRGMANIEMRYDHFFRVLPGLRIEKFHWWYSALRANGERFWVSQGEATTGPIPALGARYVVHHLCHQRDERRMLAGRAFCNDRVHVVARTGQEDDAPGLPEPAFDFVTVPY